MSKPHPSAIELTGDLMGPGVRRIADDANLSYQITRGLIDGGHVPAFKLGGRWYARRSEWASVLTGHRKPEPDPRPAPAPPQKRRRRVHHSWV